MDKGAKRAAALNRAEAGIGQFNCCGLATAQGIARLGNGQFVQIRHHSTTFGTAKNPSRASGAFDKTLDC